MINRGSMVPMLKQSYSGFMAVLGGFVFNLALTTASTAQFWHPDFGEISDDGKYERDQSFNKEPEIFSAEDYAAMSLAIAVADDLTSLSLENQHRESMIGVCLEREPSPYCLIGPQWHLDAFPDPGNYESSFIIENLESDCIGRDIADFEAIEEAFKAGRHAQFHADPLLTHEFDIRVIEEQNFDDFVEVNKWAQVCGIVDLPQGQRCRLSEDGNSYTIEDIPGHFITLEKEAREAERRSEIWKNVCGDVDYERGYKCEVDFDTLRPIKTIDECNPFPGIEAPEPDGLLRERYNSACNLFLHSPDEICALDLTSNIPIAIVHPESNEDQGDLDLWIAVCGAVVTSREHECIVDSTFRPQIVPITLNAESGLSLLSLGSLQHSNERNPFENAAMINPWLVKNSPTIAIRLHGAVKAGFQITGELTRFRSIPETQLSNEYFYQIDRLMNANFDVIDTYRRGENPALEADNLRRVEEEVRKIAPILRAARLKEAEISRALDKLPSDERTSIVEGDDFQERANQRQQETIEEIREVVPIYLPSFGPGIMNDAPQEAIDAAGNKG